MLRMDRATREIPLVVCTAAARLAVELQPHLNAMNVRVVLKPFDSDRLLNEIREALAADNSLPAM